METKSEKPQKLQKPQSKSGIKTLGHLSNIKTVAYQSLDKWDVGPKYSVVKYIGKGSYATVCQALNVQTGKKVAIKKFSKIFKSYEYAQRVLRQVALIQNLQHPCIIASEDVIIRGKKQDFSQLYLVLEYFPQDLKKIFTSNRFLDDKEVESITYQIINALRYLQTSKVLHRDLKPDNILIRDLEVKLCDFSLARTVFLDAQKDITEKLNQPLSKPVQRTQLLGDQDLKRQGGALPLPIPKKKVFTQHVVTRWYRAPQLILLQNNYDSAIDVWSVGCIYAQLLRMIKQNCPNSIDRKPMFPGGACYPFSPPSNQIAYVQKNGFPHSVHDQLSRIFEVLGTPQEEDLPCNQQSKKYLNSFERRPKKNFNQMFKHISQEGLDFLNQCLQLNPKKRMTVGQAISHKLFDRVRDTDKQKIGAPLDLGLEFLTIEQIRQRLFNSATIKSEQSSTVKQSK